MLLAQPIILGNAKKLGVSPKNKHGSLQEDTDSD